MWRMKTIAISVVVLGALLFGAVVAYAGWSWNAEVDIEGTTVSTAWSVAKGGKAQYHAAITVTVPRDASVNVVEVASSETVNVVHTEEACTGGVINTVVTYLITGTGHGDEVSVSVNQTDGDQNYGSATGTVGTPISVNVAIPGDCSG